MKKCRRGKGTMLTASFRKSAFSCPGKRRHVVTPDIVIDTAREGFFVGTSKTVEIIAWSCQLVIDSLNAKIEKCAVPKVVNYERN
jgi:hypothetical protein